MGSKLLHEPDQLLHELSLIDRSSIADDLDRRRVIAGAQALAARLQSPTEKTRQLLHSHAYLIAAVESVVNLNLFELWEQDGGHPQTVQQLGQLTQADPALLERLLRLMVAASMLSVDSAGRYVFDDSARAFTDGQLSQFWRYFTYNQSHTTVSIAKYLSEHGYRNPTDPKTAPWAYFMGLPFMDYLKAHPQYYTYWNAMIQSKNVNVPPWHTVYPLDDLVEHCEPDGVLLVDIAGGTGYDISTLADRLGSRIGPGRLILQDRAQVIQEAKELPSIVETQVYDFFTEQPVKGARAYYLHMILHDWPDEECLKILARIRDAMKSDYSRLIINEAVISPTSTAAACARDLMMMTVNAGAERTETQWRQLLAEAEFRVKRIYSSPALDDGVIEAEL